MQQPANPIAESAEGGGSNPSKGAAAAGDEISAAIQQVETELDLALMSLGGWSDAVLAREQHRFEELRLAWHSQADKIRDLDRILGQMVPTGAVVDESAAMPGDRIASSLRARQANITRLHALRDRLHADLMNTLAWVRELVTMIHLAKYTGAPASRAEELVLQIATSIEWTDALGRYRLPPVPRELPLTVIATASQPGFDSVSERVSNAEFAARVDLTISRRPRGGAIQGIVVDSQGRAVSGATLDNSPYGQLFEPKRTATDANGHFVFEDLVGDPALVDVQAAGFARKRISTTAGTKDDPAEVDIVVEAGHRARGRVVDAQGTPLEKVDVAFVKKSPWPQWTDYGFTTTDVDGRFEVDSLSNRDSFTLTFRKAGFGTIYGRPLALDTDRDERIVMDRPEVLVARVADAGNGEPIHRFNVRIDLSRRRTFSLSSAQVREVLDLPIVNSGISVFTGDGTFELSGLPPDMELQFIVDAAGYLRSIVNGPQAIRWGLPFPAPSRARPRQATNISLLQEDPSSFVRYAGRLIDEDGAPVAGAELRLVAVAGSDESAHLSMGMRGVMNGSTGSQIPVVRFEKAMSDDAGHFAFAGIPRVKRICLFWWKAGLAPGCRDELQQLAEPAEGELELRAEPAARVVGRIDLKAFPGTLALRISALRFGGQDLDRKLGPGQDEFEFADLAEGDYDLDVRALENVDSNSWSGELVIKRKLKVERGQEYAIELGEADRLRGN